MKFTSVTFLIVAIKLVACSQLQLPLWNNFKLTHDKVYNDSSEEQLRFGIFLNNLQKIEEHNKRYEQGLETYYLGVTKFTDMTEEEFADFLTLSTPAPSQMNLKNIYVPPKDFVLPEQVDYRKKNAVNPVKNQGMCGSCWAFCVIASLESIYFLKKGKLYTLSEQNLVDCANKNGGGYGGGFIDDGYDFIRDYGIETASDYPSTSCNNQCLFDPTKSVMKISGHTEIEKGNEVALQAAIAEVGPVVIGVDATKWQMYVGGIFKARGSYNLNHGAVAIGYGVENGREYYIVRNSWGQAWGESGYIRVARNAGNQVGISDLASFPVL